MLGILADDHDAALALDDLALFADRLDGRTNLHALLPPVVESERVRRMPPRILHTLGLEQSINYYTPDVTNRQGEIPYKLRFSVLGLAAPGNTATGEVVGAQLDGHLVTLVDADEVHAHLAGDNSGNLIAIGQLNLEHSVRKGFNDLAFHFKHPKTKSFK